MGIQYFGFQGPDGASFGQNSTDKISFHGATPVDKPAATEDLKDILVAYGLMTDGGATPLDLDGGALTSSGTTTLTDVSLLNDMTITNAGNIILATSTGSQIGTASTQKLGFLGATPVVRQSSTADIKDTLVAFGLVADSGATPLNLDGGAFASGSITLADAANIIAATSTGSQIGTASTQKLGFWGASPAARTAFTQAAVATTVATSTTPWGWDNSTQPQAIMTLVNEIRAALVTVGLKA